VSEPKNEIIILTSDCVFPVDVIDLTLMDTEKQADYENLGIAPNGTFVFSNFSDIYKIEKSLSDMRIIESPFKMDLIEFKN
jgi:hypothetical protein